MTRLNLREVADITFGVYNRPEEKGDVAFLQASNFDSIGNLNNNDISYLTYDANIEKNILKKDDILLTGKGFRNFAAIYKENPKPAVASSTFYIIKVKTDGLLPEYLRIFLNSDEGQVRLRKLISQTALVPTLTKSDLNELLIPIPGLDAQKKIVNLFNKWNEEKQLTQELLKVKGKYYQSVFKHILYDEIKL